MKNNNEENNSIGCGSRSDCRHRRRAYFFGFVGQPDEATIQEVDSVSSALTMRMDSLATSAVRMALPNYTRLDSLTSVLESTVWIDVEHGGEYEEQARKRFELKKKEAARAIRQVYGKQLPDCQAQQTEENHRQEVTASAINN